MMATRNKSCKSVTNHPPALQNRIMPYTFATAMLGGISHRRKFQTTLCATAARASSVRQKRLKYADFQTRENKP